MVRSTFVTSGHPIGDTGSGIERKFHVRAPRTHESASIQGCVRHSIGSKPICFPERKARNRAKDGTSIGGRACPERVRATCERGWSSPDHSARKGGSAQMGAPSTRAQEQSTSLGQSHASATEIPADSALRTEFR